MGVYSIFSLLIPGTIYYILRSIYYEGTHHVLLVVRTIRRESTREETAEFFPIKMKARTIVGRGEECPLCDPGSELRKKGELSWTGEVKLLTKALRWDDKKGRFYY